MEGDGSNRVCVVVVLCAEDAVAHACGIDMPGNPLATTTISTAVDDVKKESSTFTNTAIAAAVCPTAGRRLYLQHSPSAGIMGVMTPNTSAFWKFVDGQSASRLVWCQVNESIGGCVFE